MTGEHASQSTLPEPPMRPAWRLACLAYREVRRTGAGDWPAWQAARDAVRKVLPDLDEKVAPGDHLCLGASHRMVLARRRKSLTLWVRPLVSDETASETTSLKPLHRLPRYQSMRLALLRPSSRDHIGAGATGNADA